MSPSEGSGAVRCTDNAHPRWLYACGAGKAMSFSGSRASACVKCMSFPGLAVLSGEAGAVVPGQPLCSSPGDHLQCRA